MGVPPNGLPQHSLSNSIAISYDGFANVDLPPHELLPQVLERGLGKTLGEDISELLDGVNLDKLDSSLHNCFAKPHCLDGAVLASWSVLR